jgi:hypothetical protein
MADEAPQGGPAGDEDRPETTAESMRPARIGRDPAATLNLAMVVYIFVTLLFALPLVIAPAAFFDAIGMPEDVASELGGLRWVGAVLLAWAVSGILVLARPGGRAIFVTTGALQMTFAALSFLYSWSIDEFAWSRWYHLFATVVLICAATVLWWARATGRKVLRLGVADQA